MGCWAAPQGPGEATGGVGWARGWLAATNCIGARRRPNWPETRTEALPRRLLAAGNYGGGLGLPECSEEHGVPFYSATGLAPRRWIRSTTGRRCCSCRASWRRRTRADEHEDKHGLFPGAAGARGWLGRRRPRQSPLPTLACRQGSSAGDAAGRQCGLEVCCEGASVWRGSAGELGPVTGRVEGGSAARRLSARACKTCALGAPRARTGPTRRNARAV